jgi:hypothetical protein
MTQLISYQEYEDREEGRKRSRETDSIKKAQLVNARINNNQ